jgi:hypothetical protein
MLIDASQHIALADIQNAPESNGAANGTDEKKAAMPDKTVSLHCHR